MRVFSHLWLFIGCWCLVNSKNNSGNQLNRNNTRGVIRHQQTFDTKLNHLVVDNVADRVSAMSTRLALWWVSFNHSMFPLSQHCTAMSFSLFFFPYYTLQTLLNVLELLATRWLVVRRHFLSPHSARERNEIISKSAQAGENDGRYISILALARERVLWRWGWSVGGLSSIHLDHENW